MALTHELITRTVITSSQSSFDFTNIPATYTDLCILFSLRGSTPYNTSPHNMRFNGDTSSNYKETLLYGAGTSFDVGANASTQFGYPGIVPGSIATGGSFGSGRIYIANYRSSNYKSVIADAVSEHASAADGWQYMSALSWNNTSAITSISLYPDPGQSWLSQSSVSLYGIKNS